MLFKEIKICCYLVPCQLSQTSNEIGISHFAPYHWTYSNVHSFVAISEYPVAKLDTRHTGIRSTFAMRSHMFTIKALGVIEY